MLHANHTGDITFLLTSKMDKLIFNRAEKGTTILIINLLLIISILAIVQMNKYFYSIKTYC